MSTVSLDQHEAAAAGPVGPTIDETVRSALGSVRAEGLEPDAFGMALFDAVGTGEQTVDDAIERALAYYTA